MTRVFDAPRRLVFDDPWYQGEAVDTLVMVEQGGKTTVTTIVRYASRQVRDAVLASGMSRGVAESYDKLAVELASIARAS